MHSFICWYCSKEFSYDGEKYRYVNCPNCGAMNSVYNPDKADWVGEPEQEEEKMGGLKDWADKNSKFIKLSDGESCEGIYEGSKIVVKDCFGEEREIVRYKIDGKTFDSTSMSLARQMDGIPEGQRISIAREGEGTETKYKVTLL